MIGEMLGFLASGGPVIVAIAAVSLAVWYRIAERGLYLLREGRDGGALLERALAAWRRGGPGAARAVAEEGRGAAARAIARALEGRSEEAVLARFREARAGEEAGLARGLPIAHALVVAAPLLGLLGTIHGMVASFDVLAVLGDAPARELSGGIAQALVTTEAGLAVAVPALFAIRAIEGRIRRVRERLDRAEARLARLAAGEATAGGGGGRC